MEVGAEVFDGIGQKRDRGGGDGHADAVSEVFRVEAPQGADYARAGALAAGGDTVGVVDFRQPVAGDARSVQVGDDPVELLFRKDGVGRDVSGQAQVVDFGLAAGVGERCRERRPVAHRLAAVEIELEMIFAAPREFQRHVPRLAFPGGGVAVGAAQVAGGGEEKRDGDGFGLVGENGARRRFRPGIHDLQAAQEFDRLVSGTSAASVIPEFFRPSFPEIGEEIHDPGVADERGAAARR